MLEFKITSQILLFFDADQCSKHSRNNEERFDRISEAITVKVDPSLEILL